MMAGAYKMPLWSAECWDTAMPPLHLQPQQVSPQQSSTFPGWGCVTCLVREVKHTQKAPEQSPLHEQQESRGCLQRGSSFPSGWGSCMSSAAWTVPKGLTSNKPTMQPSTHLLCTGVSLGEKKKKLFLLSNCFLFVCVFNSSSKGTGQIWLDDVNCRGSETSIFDCSKSNWGVHNCNHNEDAGLECSWWDTGAALGAAACLCSLWSSYS